MILFGPNNPYSLFASLLNEDGSEYSSFENYLKKDNETNKCACSCNKKQDEQHFCKDCKWSGIKNKTDRVCTHSRWNSGNTCTDVKDNDFCSYWEKRKVKPTLNQKEIELLKFMKDFGYNYIDIIQNPFSTVSFTLFFDIDNIINDFRCTITVEKNKFENLLRFSGKQYKIDDLLKG